MSDEIDVRSGSAISVETDELYLVAARLGSFSGDARTWSHEAAIARCVTQWSVEAAPFGFAEADLARAAAILQDVAAESEELGILIERIAERYAAGERRLTDAWTGLAALGSFLAGAYVRNLILGSLPMAPAVAVALLLSQHPEVRRLAAVVGQPVVEALAEHADELATPEFVAVVRTLVSSADDFALGLAGVPLQTARFLGEEGAGVVGLSSMAGSLLILAGRNAYTHTPLSMSRSTVGAVAAPVTLADAAARIPVSGSGKPQVRVERYPSSNGDPSYAVYIAGTSDFSTGGKEPFDMSSNLAGIAGGDTAAQQATVEAMEDAGIEPGDPVSFFGHSQGGLVAARIAASEVYSTESVVTFGSPTGQIPLPDSIAHVAVEHAEDVTPALGGTPADGRERVVVTRSLFDESGPPPGASFGSAHHMARYAETAVLIDHSADPRLNPLRDALAGFGASGTAALYRSERVRDP